MVDMRYYKVTLCQQRGASQLMRVEICWRDHKSRCDDTRDRNWRMCQTFCERHRPATSNSISSVTLLVSAASRSSWLASSSVPSSVGIPLIDRRRSPTCSRPHLRQGLPWCQKDWKHWIFTLIPLYLTVFVLWGLNPSFQKTTAPMLHFLPYP